jgi:hypothetical protein
MTSKWKLSDLLNYLPKHPELFDQPVTKEQLLKEMKRTLERTFTATYSKQLENGAKNLNPSYPTKYFGLYGADLCLFKNGKMKIFEVNLGPSLDTSNQLDFEVKFPMLREAFDLVGFRTEKYTFNQHLETDEEWKDWFNDSLSVMEKRVLAQLVDEGLRQREWIKLETEITEGKWNKFVNENKAIVKKEINKRK